MRAGRLRHRECCLLPAPGFLWWRMFLSGLSTSVPPLPNGAEVTDAKMNELVAELMHQTEALLERSNVLETSPGSFPWTSGNDFNGSLATVGADDQDTNFKLNYYYPQLECPSYTQEADERKRSYNPLPNRARGQTR